MNEKMLTNTDLANLLQVTRRQIRRMTLDGRLPPPIQLGRFPRWRETAIREWLQDAERRSARKAVRA